MKCKTLLACKHKKNISKHCLPELKSSIARVKSITFQWNGKREKALCNGNYLQSRLITYGKEIHLQGRQLCLKCSLYPLSIGVSQDRICSSGFLFRVATHLKGVWFTEMQIRGHKS